MMLGNLTIEEIEKRLGINFPIETKKFMRETYQAHANNIDVDKRHCFNAPFTLMCGDKKTAIKIYKSIENKSSECK